MSDYLREHEFEDPTNAGPQPTPVNSGPLSSLDGEQRARVAALNLAAPLLTSTAMLSSKPPEVLDLLRVSQWILTGEDMLDDQRTYPINSGDVTILGPEVFVTDNGDLICYRGRNFYANQENE